MEYTMTKMKERKIFNFKCPFCESDKLYFHYDGDYIDIKNKNFIKEVTCNFCGNKFSICGSISNEIFIKQI
jgi:transcription elongation factor Elf1